NLSFLARWFAIWLAARPPGWEIRAGLLPYQIKDRSRPSGHLGRDSTRRLLRELQNAGYLIRSRYRDCNGQWLWRSSFNATKNVASTIAWNTVDGDSVDGVSGDITDTDLTPKLNHSTRTTTTGAEANKATGGQEESPVVVVGSTLNLEMPDILKGPLTPSACAIIERCPEAMRQTVLDEIRAVASRGRVRNPIGLLHRLVERVITGEFVATQAKSDRHTHRSNSANATHSGAKSCTSGRDLPVSDDIARQRIAEIRKKLRGGSITNES
ncbi:MAG: hypothetical protein ABI451_10745, partial [Dokdonella sp.]